MLSTALALGAAEVWARRTWRPLVAKPEQFRGAEIYRSQLNGLGLREGPLAAE